MNIDFNSEKPIFIQIAEQIEDAIFVGAFEEETQIPSTTELSTTLKINPATVLKGMNLLIEDNIIYKKRGVGVFVSTGALQNIQSKRRTKFYETYIESLVEEAKKLGLTKKEVISYIEQSMEGE